MLRPKMFKWICLFGITGMVVCAGGQSVAAESDVGVFEIAAWKQDIAMGTASTTRDVTNVKTSSLPTTRDITSEKIMSLPVTNVADILLTLGSTSRGDDRFHIRGTRTCTLIYIVEDVVMSDPLGAERNLTSADLWTLKEGLYGDTGGFLDELRSDLKLRFDLDENGAVDSYKTDD